MFFKMKQKLCANAPKGAPQELALKPFSESLSLTPKF